MRSRTSCFNPTLYKKNLTRFAPAWGLYTLCLILGMALIYVNGGADKRYHFAANLADLIQIMGGINLLYAPLVAQLLFGDLYNSRMCYALHAMPVRRESLFWTNIASGLTFSAVPTLVMCLISMPLLLDSCFEKAMLIPFYVFAGINLQFVCFFGMSVFCCLCVGNRLSMVLFYGLLNFGAGIAYWLIDTLYTPMLYGVVTPDRLATLLTPVVRLTEEPYLRMVQWYELGEQFNRDFSMLSGLSYSVTEKWGILAVWAAVGIAFLIVAMMLYKKRDLECAGDAMAFRALEPVFQVLGAVVTAAAAQFFISEFLGFRGEYHYIFLITGLVIGWFACRMLIERGTRVFRLRNWYGLFGLTAALALSLVLTNCDVLGIETWMPEAESVRSVALSHYHPELTDKEDIQKILNLQAEALDTRLEESGAYVQDEEGRWVLFLGVETHEDMEKWQDYDSRYAYYANIVYTLENGKEVARRYPIWFDGQAADDAREILSRWEYVGNEIEYVDGKEISRPVLDNILATLENLYVEGVDSPIKEADRAMAEELIAAIRADCEAGTMAQVRHLQSGHFRCPDPENEGQYYYRPSLYVSLSGEERGWGVEIYPQCENTLNWLRAHDLLTYDIVDNTLCFY